MTIGKPSTQQAVINALAKQEDELTSAEIAAAAGLGRSTVGKTLAALEREGMVRRVPGGRDGQRRRPDRWSVRASDERAASGESTVRGSSSERLRPGQLDGLVLDVINADDTDTRLGATAVAKALGRSAGAVGNCLARLAAAGRVRQASEHPRRYSHAAPGSDASQTTPPEEEP